MDTVPSITRVTFNKKSRRGLIIYVTVRNGGGVGVGKRGAEQSCRERKFSVTNIRGREEGSLPLPP